MVINTLTNDPSTDISRTISLLNDLYNALKENDYSEEARVVSNHLQQLLKPDIQLRIQDRGLDPVMSEFAQQFYNES